LVGDDGLLAGFNLPRFFRFLGVRFEKTDQALNSLLRFAIQILNSVVIHIFKAVISCQYRYFNCDESIEQSSDNIGVCWMDLCWTLFDRRKFARQWKAAISKLSTNQIQNTIDACFFDKSNASSGTLLQEKYLSLSDINSIFRRLAFNGIDLKLTSDQLKDFFMMLCVSDINGSYSKVDKELFYSFLTELCNGRIIYGNYTPIRLLSSVLPPPKYILINSQSLNNVPQENLSNKSRPKYDATEWTRNSFLRKASHTRKDNRLETKSPSGTSKITNKVETTSTPKSTNQIEGKGSKFESQRLNTAKTEVESRMKRNKHLSPHSTHISSSLSKQDRDLPDKNLFRQSSTSNKSTLKKSSLSENDSTKQTAVEDKAHVYDIWMKRLLAAQETIEARLKLKHFKQIDSFHFDISDKGEISRIEQKYPVISS
jgi:hypothetical protein